MGNLNPQVLEFLRYRFNLYQIGFSCSGEIVDPITPGLLKEGFIKCIMKEDYEWDCERKGIKPDTYSLKKYLDQILKTCYKMAKEIKTEDDVKALLAKLPPGEFTAANLNYPKTFVCD